jgi:hypothetical protein
MFKIRHNTARQFCLAEILLMVAINYIEAKQKNRRTQRLLAA